MSNKASYTTIPVRPEVRDRIRRLKGGQETYSELLATLADLYESVDDTPSQDATHEAHQRL